MDLHSDEPHKVQQRQPIFQVLRECSFEKCWGGGHVNSVLDLGGHVNSVSVEKSL